MYAVTSAPDVSRTRATLRSAEFGFRGVVVKTRVQTPRRKGEPFRAAVRTLVVLACRPLRTSWAIVGTRVLAVDLEVPGGGCSQAHKRAESQPGRLPARTPNSQAPPVRRSRPSDPRATIGRVPVSGAVSTTSSVPVLCASHAFPRA